MGERGDCCARGSAIAALIKATEVRREIVDRAIGINYAPLDAATVSAYRMESRTSSSKRSMAVTRMRPRRGYSMSMIT